MKRIHIPESYVLYSTTDVHGTITDASDDFVHICGYTKAEMIGKPHNIIRHPSVPKQVFSDMWATLKAGNAWSATVVNQAKSGDEYWVNAKASPIVENNQVTGYVSVRTAATEQEIEAAKNLYQKIEKGQILLKNGLPRHPLDTKLDLWRNQPMFRKIMAPVLGMFLVGALITAERLNHMKDTSLHAAGQNAASDMITMAKNSRQFYMDEIIPKVRQAGMQLSHDYASHPTNLPLAANVMLALGEMSKSADGDNEVGEVKLFSAHPFKFRGAANLDDFEKNALAALEKNPNQPYIQIEQQDGRSYFRMAAPDFMTSQSCLNCHNHDPNSSKQDWQIGDVRGAISARIPMSDLENSIGQASIQLGWFLLFGALSLLFFIYWIMYGFKKRLIDLKNAVSHVETSGDFSYRPLDKSKDEIGQTFDQFNIMQNAVLATITKVSQTARAISLGDFTQLSQGAKGSFEKLQDNVNDATTSLDSNMQELSKVMQALENGQFDAKMDPSVPQAFRDQVERTLSTIDHVMADIISVMKGMEQGDFSARVTVEARGELADLKQAINSSMNAVSDAIHKISDVMAAQAAGDLTVTLPSGMFKGELQKLEASINSSISRLDGIIVIAAEAAYVVDTAAGEVSKGSHDLSERVQEQAAALEQTSATMDEMNSTIQQNSENTQHASDVARGVQQKAEQGSEVMEQTISAMQAIQESSHKIEEIVTLIDSIAFQTNLLALNAAVEAARAGDHGRGFAVVAGEVRGLAQKSAEAAKDIKKLITESVDRIDHGTKLATKSGEVLSGITHSINEVTTIIEQVAKATQEQAQGIHQVHDAITSIDKVTQQNAALVEQTTAASESMRDQSNNLSKEMAFFKTTSTKHAKHPSVMAPPQQKPKALTHKQEH